MATKKKKTKTEKPTGEWWLLPANAPDEIDTWVALVLVDRAELKRASEALQRLKAEGLPVRSMDLHTARLWWFTEATVRELCHCDEIAEATRCNDAEGHMLADSGADERTECDVVTLWVDGDCVWGCYPDGSDSHVETELFQLAQHPRAVGT